MAEQLKLPFDEVPINCPVQEKYHAIAPVLAGRKTPQEQAEILNISYSKIMRWLREFKENGMAGLFEHKSKRQPYTPERIIVSLLYYKCCAPKASDLELARVISNVTGHHLHNETVKSLLERYFFWRYEEFQELVKYPIPQLAQLRRLEMLKLKTQGFSEKTIAHLLATTTKTVRKWLRRAKEELAQKSPTQLSLLDHSHAPQKPKRKVQFGTIHIVLKLQKKYGYDAGWFRIKGYLEKDYGIFLGESTIKKIMKLNRQLNLAPLKPIEIVSKEIREAPLKSQRPFEHTFIDIRYLDAKPEGVQLYSCFLLEGLSRTILAGSLTRRQDVGIILRIYYLAALEFGLWDMVVSDHGGQFTSKVFNKVNKRLCIYHHLNDKGHPWENLIESQFKIQARMGEYSWAKCSSVNEAVEIHRELIRDHNRLPHFAHIKRQDNKHSPLEVLSSARGREVDSATLHRAFSRQFWNRKIDSRGFIKVNRWKVYVEAGLPKEQVQVSYWDKKLRAEYENSLLAEYNCKWDSNFNRPKSITNPQFFENPYNSAQLSLFDLDPYRHPVELFASNFPFPKKIAVGAEQLKFYFGPELLK